MSVKLKVNKDSCIGCGLCTATHPDAFVMDDEGKAECVAEVAAEEAEEVIGNCPVQAIEE